MNETRNGKREHGSSGAWRALARLTAAAGLCLACGPMTAALGQTVVAVPSGAGTSKIKGRVTTENGEVLGGAVVQAKQVSVNTPGKFYGMNPAAQRYHHTRAKAADGTYEFSGLAAGTYELCVMDGMGQTLNPCEWAERPPQVWVETGGVVDRTLVAERGELLHLRVDDEEQVLESDAKKKAGVDLGVYVQNARGEAMPVRAGRADGKGRNYVVRVPVGKRVRVMLAGSKLDVKDAAGRGLARGQAVASGGESDVVEVEVKKGREANFVRVNVKEKK